MHPSRERASRSALRRYPALAFLVVATVLAVALPSALTLPNAGPPTLAEFAPVPGSGAGAGGDLGRLGSGSSGAPGFGGGEPVAPGQPDLDPGQPGGSFKRCVGSPPRQTEDPLSPPCVAFFEGDNGGATARGVTADEITVVVYFRRVRSQATTGQSSPPEGSLIDYDEDLSPGDFYQDRAMKIYARYFNERYQTYRRHVHFYGLYTVPYTDPNVIPQRRADAARVHAMGAFATIAFDANPIEPYVQEATKRGMLAVTFSAFERAFYRRAAPLLWGFLPDLEDQARLAASYVCRKLGRGDAIHSGNLTDTTRARVFGIAFTQSENERQYAQLADLVTARLHTQCGVDVAAAVSTSEVYEQAQQQAPLAIATLRDAEVTTVIHLGLPNTALALSSSASAIRWSPEWFVAGRREHNGLDQGGAARLMPQDQWAHAFGITFGARWGRDEEMHWSRAYRETCACGPIERFWTSGLYDPMALLLYGIQASGPRLTVANFDKGMHAIPPRASTDAFTPAAYFTVNNYTYVKDAMEIWWDPASSPPTDSQPGCYRIPNEGRRFRAREWHRGDTQAFRDGPCNGHAAV